MIELPVIYLLSQDPTLDAAGITISVDIITSDGFHQRKWPFFIYLVGPASNKWKIFSSFDLDPLPDELQYLYEDFGEVFPDLEAFIKKVEKVEDPDDLDTDEWHQILYDVFNYLAQSLAAFGIGHFLVLPFERMPPRNKIKLSILHEDLIQGLWDLGRDAFMPMAEIFYEHFFLEIEPYDISGMADCDVYRLKWALFGAPELIHSLSPTAKKRAPDLLKKVYLRAYFPALDLPGVKISPIFDNRSEILGLVYQTDIPFINQTREIPTGAKLVVTIAYRMESNLGPFEEGIFLKYNSGEVGVNLPILDLFNNLWEEKTRDVEQGFPAVCAYARALARVPFSNVNNIAERVASLGKDRKQELSEIPVDAFFMYFLHESPSSAFEFLAEFFKLASETASKWFGNHFPSLQQGQITSALPAPPEFPAILSNYLAPVNESFSHWAVLGFFYEQHLLYGEALYCWKQIPEDDDACPRLMEIDRYRPMERLPPFLQSAPIPPTPPAEDATVKFLARIPDLDPYVEARKLLLEQVFSPDIPHKIRTSVLENIIARPREIKNYQHLSAVELLEYLIYLWAKTEISYMPHVSGGRFQTMGLDCFFQLVRPDNPLVQLPREIAFRNDNDWELRLFGECDYSEDYSNMDLDEGEIIAPLVQVEINIIPLLREDGHHDLEVNFPDDYFDEE